MKMNKTPRNKRLIYFTTALTALWLASSLFAAPSTAKLRSDATMNIEPAIQYDQYNRFDRQEAINSCQEEAKHRLVADLATWGARYSLSFDRNAQVNQVSAAKASVDGTGRFAPSSDGRTRPFKYTCIYSVQSARVATLNYEFTDPNNTPNRPSWDSGYRPPPSYNPGGRVWYSGAISNRESAKVLDVEARSNRDAANVQQWSNADQSNQKWDVIDLGGGQFSIISQGSNKALDVANNSDRDGANVQQYRWHGGDNQRWFLRRRTGDWYEIVNVHSGRCLDVENRSRADGANIQQWNCSGAPNQSWKFSR